MIQKLQNISDKALRLSAILILLPLVGLSLYLHGSFSWLLAMLTLSTALNAPKIKEAVLKIDPRLAVGSVILLVASLATFPWIPQQFAMICFALGNFPMIQEMQIQMMKKMGLKMPEPPKAKKVKPVKMADPASAEAVPAKPRTNTQRKRDALLAKLGKKG